MVVDKYEDEPVKEIDRDRFLLWQAYRREIQRAQLEEARLRAEIEEEMGAATAATIDGIKVITYRPKAGYSVTGILRDYPELAQHYLHTQKKETLDVQAFVKQHPDIAAKYQTREFREAS